MSRKFWLKANDPQSAFWKWVDDHLPQPPKPKTVEIGEALGQAKPFSNLSARVANLEDRLNRAEKAVDELFQLGSYPTSPPPPKTHVRASLGD
jgi:hypothetical protein